MKRLIQILFVLLLLAFISGFAVKSYHDSALGDRIIGIAVLASSFVLMPLFIYHRAKGKKMEDYMLTKENIDKMNEKTGKYPDNQ